VKTFFAYFTWILFSIQVSLPLAITIVFWGALYDPGFDTQDTVMGALEHGVTEILILIEILFCLRVKLVLLHMVIPAIFGIVYVAANIGITFAGFTDPKTGQNYIYSLTDWKGDPVTAVITTVALLFGGIPVTYSIHYGISQLKQKCIPDCVAIESNASTTVNVGMVVMSDKKTLVNSQKVSRLIDDDSDEDEAPAKNTKKAAPKKAAAKKGKKADSDEDEEDEKPKKGGKKTPAKKGKKDEDEDEDEDEEPKKNTKKAAPKKAVAKKGKKDESDDDDDDKPKKKTTGSKTTKKSSPYRDFVSKEMRRLRKDNPGKGNNEYMKLAAKNWKTCPDNPKCEKPAKKTSGKKSKRVEEEDDE